LRDGSRQRRLAMVDVTYGRDVEVGLGPLELLLRHCLLLTSPSSAPAHCLREVAWHLCVMTELHRIRRAPRGHGPKLGRVPEHLRQGDVRAHVLRRAAALHAQDVATP